MTPAFTARRRAEEFATLVERPLAGTAEAPRRLSAADAARYASLLDLVAEMRELPPVEPSPGFVADLRERLLAEAPQALATAAARADLPQTERDRLTLPARSRRRDRRIAALVGGLAVVGATSSVAVAAQDALPGDALYPVKRAIEEAHTGISLGEGQKGSTLLGIASSRLDEADQLSRGGDLADEAAVADTLNSFTGQAQQASGLLIEDYEQTGHESSIARLRDFTAQSLDRLTALEPLVPTSARDELMHAARVVVDLDSSAQRACPSCGGPGITEIPPVLTSSAHLFPQSPTDSSTGGRGDGGDSGARQQAGSGLPTLDPDDLAPGSVLDPDSGADGSGDEDVDPLHPVDTANQDPLQTLTDQLTGGDSSSQGPSLPDVGDTVKHVGKDVGKDVKHAGKDVKDTGEDLVEGTTSQLGDTLR